MAAILKGKSYAPGDGADTFLRALLSGEIGIADYVAVSALRGRLYTASFGSVTTPITWEATATIDVTKPAAFMDVGSGIAIIPVSIALYMEAFGTNAQFECNAVIGTGGSRTSGMSEVTPIGSRSDVSTGSGVTAWTGDNSTVVVGSTTRLNEFWHDGKQFAITKTAESATVTSFDPIKFSWKAAEEGFVVAGPDSELAIHQGSQAGTGFCKVRYIEIPASELPS